VITASLTAPSSVLAFVTTLHLAIAVLRAHRSPTRGVVSFVNVVSMLWAASPWLMPTTVGITIGVAAHIAWFVACERMLPVVTARPVRGAIEPIAVPRPITAPRPAPDADAAARAGDATRAIAKRPREFVKTPVLAVFDETPDIRTFRMARPEGFDFKAGQFVAIRVRADGREHVRCYSVSSAPEARGHIEISVKRLGVVSGALHATVRPGSFVHLKAPVGAFTYPAGEDRPIVLIAGGVGITPLMSMLRHAVDQEPTRPLTLFYSARRVQDLAFHDDIRLLDRRHAQFRAFFTITDAPAPRGCFQGHINEALLASMMPDIAHAACFVCGPPPMIDAMKSLLVSLGVPASQTHSEVFKAAIAAAAGAPPLEAPEPAASVASAYRARFERSGVLAMVEPDQTLLEASETCGAAIPSLCRAGVCGTCRTRVISGQVDCASQTLDADDRADGYVLPCVSRLKGDCVVEA
jgi:ferredoxin-NADP reductase